MLVVKLSDLLLPLGLLIIINHQLLLLEHGQPLPLKGVTKHVLLADSLPVLLNLLVILGLLDLDHRDRRILVTFETSHELTQGYQGLRFPS